MANPRTRLTTALKNDGSTSDPAAQEMRARATIAAATMTKAYSAVACPDSDFIAHLLTQGTGLSRANDWSTAGPTASTTNPGRMRRASGSSIRTGSLRARSTAAACSVCLKVEA